MADQEPKSKSVQDVYEENPRGFAAKVAQAGGNGAFSRLYRGGKTDVRRLKFASEERIKEHRDDLGTDALLAQLEQARAENERLSDVYHQIESTFSVVNTWEPVKPATLPKPSSADEHVAFFLLSDSQIGSNVIKHRTGGIESFNRDIFDVRVERYKDAVTSIFPHNLCKSFPVRKACVFLAGDIIEGEGIYPLQEANLDLLLMQQIMHAIKKYGEILLHLCRLFPDGVSVYCVYGNHGRARSLTINFDLMCYLMLQQILGDQPNIDFFISGCSYLICSLAPDIIDIDTPDKDWPEHIYGLIHGNQIKRYMDTPAYGFNRAVRRFQDMASLTLDSMFAGHHHQRATGYDGKWYINGSWVGGTDYSTEWLQAASQPCQLSWVWHPQWGLAYEIPIFLDEKPRLTRDQRGLYSDTIDGQPLADLTVQAREARERDGR